MITEVVRSITRSISKTVNILLAIVNWIINHIILFLVILIILYILYKFLVWKFKDTDKIKLEDKDENQYGLSDNSVGDWSTDSGVVGDTQNQ